MPFDDPPETLEHGLQQLVDQLLQRPLRVMLFGAPGSGKSTLAAQLAARLAEHQQPCACLSADPGSPAFGLPAAVNLGVWQQDSWQLLGFEALCSLNAARFRLPLVIAAQRLLRQAPAMPLLIDMPGVVQGVAGAELLSALAASLQPERLVILGTSHKPPALPQECASLPLTPLRLQAAADAREPSKRERATDRTERWTHYLQRATDYPLELQELSLLGTPPPLTQPHSWQGRLVALGTHDRTLVMGEVVALQQQADQRYVVQIRSPPLPEQPSQLLIRDAVHLPGQPVTTLPPVRPKHSQPPTIAYPTAFKPPTSGPHVHTGEAVAEMINGIFDDPLLLISLRQARRCLLFDLGDTGRLPLRYIHHVSDVFISHAHIDHIGGFMGLLRTRLGAPSSACRLYGPPGLAGHIWGMLSGILWDRIGDAGPVFEVAELHGQQLRRFRLQAGQPRPQPLADRSVERGVILQDQRFLVRSVQLDHRTPVLAYAFEPIARLHVCTEQLEQQGLPPGPWLAELKEAQLAGELQRVIELPDGRRLPAAQLARQLLQAQPGDKLVYATDLADTPDNRRRLSRLAQGAHTLFCEACFANADRDRAWEHGHLTTGACAAIAASAGVQQLAPFHFSKRYEGAAERMYGEIAQTFERIVQG